MREREGAMLLSCPRPCLFHGHLPSLLPKTTTLLHHASAHKPPLSAIIRASRDTNIQEPAIDASVAAAAPAPTTAKDAVNLGLQLFSKGRVKDALAQFDAALAMNPEPEEAKAALYNKACCHAYREEGEQAYQALLSVLRDYNLKFGVILNDPDLASFRAMKEFKQLQEEAIKGGEKIGDSFRRDLKLISEVQDPFRAIRKFFYIAFTAAAGISTFLTVPRLFRALQDGYDLPTLQESSQNLAINLVGIVAFIALYIWDSRKEEEQIARISRDETLSRLPLQLSTNRIVELVQLRDTTRPVILAGKREMVIKAVQRAEKYRNDLLKRGVLLVPLYLDSRKVEPIKKRGFGSFEKPSSSVSAADDFEKRIQDVAASGVIEAERRFKAEVVDPARWQRWIKEQQEAEDVKAGEDVYIVLRLDGRIRKSALGMPDWDELIKELPPLDAFVSKLEK